MHVIQRLEQLVHVAPDELARGVERERKEPEFRLGFMNSANASSSVRHRKLFPALLVKDIWTLGKVSK